MRHNHRGDARLRTARDSLDDLAVDSRSTSGSTTDCTGLLMSGGLDSAILLALLLKQKWRVQPFYVRMGLRWESAELQAVSRFTAALAQPGLLPLISLDLPIGDTYQNHWSITGRDVPSCHSDDKAVFLPGRNLLLIVKAALWCQLHHVGSLALATLGSNHFSDAKDCFFQSLESVLGMEMGNSFSILRPFEQSDKRAVMQIGKDLPLELTFSCISPVKDRHCGSCNKCFERHKAFELADRVDPTSYVEPDFSATTR